MTEKCCAIIFTIRNTSKSSKMSGKNQNAQKHVATLGIISPTVTGLIVKDRTQDEWENVFLITAAVYAIGTLDHIWISRHCPCPGNSFCIVYWVYGRGLRIITFLKNSSDSFHHVYQVNEWWTLGWVKSDKPLRRTHQLDPWMSGS